jgi:hypothetical protein
MKEVSEAEKKAESTRQTKRRISFHKSLVSIQAAPFSHRNFTGKIGGGLAGDILFWECNKQTDPRAPISPGPGVRLLRVCYHLSLDCKIPAIYDVTGVKARQGTCGRQAIREPAAALGAK